MTIARFHYVAYGAGGLLLVTLAAMARLTRDQRGMRCAAPWWPAC